MEEIKEPSFWERLKNRIFGGVSALFSLLGIGYFCSAMLMGNYYACTDKENSSYQYSLFQGAIWPYHVFINPEWKEDRAEMTYRLGSLLCAVSGPREATEESIREESKAIEGWVDELPDTERNDLEKAAVAYSKFCTEYTKKLNEQIFALEGYNVKIDGKLKMLSEGTSNFPELMNAFNDYLDDSRPFLREHYSSFVRTINENLSKAPAIDSQTGLPTGMSKESAKEFLESKEVQEQLEKVVRPKTRARMESYRVMQNRVLEKLFSKPSLLPDTP